MQYCKKSVQISSSIRTYLKHKDSFNFGIIPVKTTKEDMKVKEDRRYGDCVAIELCQFCAFYVMLVVFDSVYVPFP